MTVIAYKAGILAADRMVVWRGLRVGTTTKVFRLDSGILCGIAGATHDAAAVHTWLRVVGMDFVGLDCPTLKDENSEAIIITPGDERFIYSGCVNGKAALRIDSEFYATGAGMDLALGAMAAGKSAIEAARIACDLEIHCGGGIDWVSLDGNGGRIDGST